MEKNSFGQRQYTDEAPIKKHPGVNTLRSSLTAGTPHSFMGDSLRLELVQNPGSSLEPGGIIAAAIAIFGVHRGRGLGAARLAGAAFFATGLDRRRCVALAMLAGGGAGNLIDRICHDGRATDFLNLGMGTLRTGIFTIADMAILGGAILLILRCAARTI